MKNAGSQLSNPFSTGGGGPRFENQVQSAFVVLMLTGGTAPCVRPLPIKKIKLQGKYDGYNTDDFIVFLEAPKGDPKAKLLAQIKHSIIISENDPVFAEVIQAAWSDFQDHSLFDPATDAIALITGPLSATDIENARVLLERARHSATAKEFFDKVKLGKFTSEIQRKKLKAFRSQLEKANGNKDIGDESLWLFLKSFRLLGYDLDEKSGVTLSLLHSHLAQFQCGDAPGLWAKIAEEVESFNQNAGTITIETLSSEIKMSLSQHAPVAHIPAELLKQGAAATAAEFIQGEKGNVLALASLLGAWNEKSQGDQEAIKRLLDQ
ncbi:MAG TPA: hypothetical protein VG938_18905 [Verrucomicrobiae bacterium]|jgi:hypothetical protein|nr:hypothetical protein [Verrucomicrobiae bacterium]